MKEIRLETQAARGLLLMFVLLVSPLVLVLRSLARLGGGREELGVKQGPNIRTTGALDRGPSLA